MPTQAAVEEIPGEDEEAIEYRSCPNLWFKTPIMGFFEIMEDIAKYPHTAVPLKDRQPRYRAFEKYYESIVADFEDRKRMGGAK